MRPLLALLTAGLLAGPAAAGPITFDFTGQFVEYDITVTGTYLITAAGAQGGNSSAQGQLGARGAVASGRFELDAGTVLRIAVGGTGGSSFFAGGGGGGTFVVAAGGTPIPLVVAGGGGGAGVSGFGGPAGDGPAGSGFGGARGLGGDGGGGGGGFLSNGANGGGGGGQGYDNGLAGGGGRNRGGFGGGGGSGDLGGGGGGGYSGGNGGVGGGAGGSGGTSFVAAFALDPTVTGNAQAGNGFASVELLPAAVPEPGSMALLTVGGLGLAAWGRRRVRAARD